MAGETMLTIIGNLTADPELRTTGGGTPVANFTVASTPRTFNRETKGWEDGPALFMRCSAWRDMASHCASSLAKGMRVIVRGTLGQRSYTANDGSNRTVVELTVDEIGPSLRYATAQVHRITQRHGFNGTYGDPNRKPFPANSQPARQNAGQQPALGTDPFTQRAADAEADAEFGNVDSGQPEF
ncbi:single-stranded DNA-binding protein [Bifidobacterium sp. ESL0728]|uniref:single-stranded DNA-binding protein n=1 Tax=Bifidobacterium sp. ESL0728 TaxID=2983220 RepID=UPI0023F6F5D8|nr:single-stranded DNA-binding protein [Bifidobacterium sp. ESL0728]WEV59944.1 single-stranded DNA-binding protein [Bifidobacterium sp. ESL0728]